MNDAEPVLLRCSAVVFHDDSVLLCRRESIGASGWILPGGSPRPGEGASSCTRREVLEETGVAIDADRVAFVLETTSPDRRHHLVEMVFLGAVIDTPVRPVAREPHLVPELVSIDELSSLELLPPLGGYILGLARDQRLGQRSYGTAAYLGNVWRPGGTDPAGTRPVA